MGLHRAAFALAVLLVLAWMIGASLVEINGLFERGHEASTLSP